MIFSFLQHYGEPDVLSYEDLGVLEREKAHKEYQQWEELVLEKRPMTISEEKLYEMMYVYGIAEYVLLR